MTNCTFKKKKITTIEIDYPLLMEKIKSKYIDLTRQKTLLREETRDAKVKAKNKKHNKTIKPCTRSDRKQAVIELEIPLL